MPTTRARYYMCLTPVSEQEVAAGGVEVGTRSGWANLEW